MSKRRMYLLASLMGAVLAGLTIVAALAYSSAHETKQQQQRSDHDIALIAQRVFRIESPTEREFNMRLLDALKRCNAHPPCKSLFRTTAPRGRRGPDGRRGPRGFRGRPGMDAQSLRGPQGAPGRDGRTVTGPQGPPGADGAPAPPTVLSGFERRIQGLEQRVNTLGCNLRKLLAQPC